MPGLRLIAIAAATLAVAIGAVVYVWRLDEPARTPARVLFIIGDSAEEKRSLLLEGARAAASEHGVQLQAKSLDELLRSSCREKCLAMCEGMVLATERDESNRQLEQLAGSTKVVTVGRSGPSLKPLCHIEAGAYHVARMLVQTAHEALPSGGAIALLLNAERDSEQADQLAAFKAVINQYSVGAANSPRPSYELIEREISEVDSSDDIRTVLAGAYEALCVVDFTGDRAMEIVEGVGRMADGGNVRIITLDQSDAALAAVENGSIYAVVGHDPFDYGYIAVAKLASLCRCGKLGLPLVNRGGVNVRPVCLRRDNVAEFRTRLQSLNLSAAGQP